MNQIPPLYYLNANKNISFSELKNAYPDYDETKLKSVYDGFKKFLGKDPDLTPSFGYKAVDVVQKSLQTQESGKQFRSLQEEMVNVTDIFDVFMDKSKNKFRDFGGILTKIIKDIGNNAELYLEQQTALLERVNSEAGLTGQLSKDFREEISNANPKLLQMGISFGDLAESAIQLVKQSGRFSLINQEIFERGGEIAKSYVGTLQQLVAMYPEFEKIGIGASDAQESIALAGKESLELGLRSQTITEELSKNLGKLNEYGFKNGVRGLEEMTRKSVEFRTSLDSVTTIANKVFSPEGAIDFSANLQVLGGVIGDFNDPLKLMYMATNNIEGLQDSLFDASKSLATYNQEQGRFEITGVNLRRAKEMADQFGMSLGDLSKTAIAAAERSSAAADLLGRGLMLDEEQQRFITNIAQMKDGKMTIELQSEFLKNQFEANEIALEDLDQNQAELLLKYQDQFKKLSENDIVRNQATNIENMKRDLNFIVAYLRMRGGQAGEAAAELAGINLKSIADETQKMSGKSAEWLSSMGKYVQDTFNIDLTTKSNIRFNEPNSPMTPEKQKNIESNQNKQTTQNNQVNTTIIHKHEHSINATQPILDTFKREVAKDPSTFESMNLDYRDFLNSRS